MSLRISGSEAPSAAFSAASLLIASACCAATGAGTTFDSPSASCCAASLPPAASTPEAAASDGFAPFFLAAAAISAAARPRDLVIALATLLSPSRFGMLVFRVGLPDIILCWLFIACKTIRKIICPATSISVYEFTSSIRKGSAATLGAACLKMIARPMATPRTAAPKKHTSANTVLDIKGGLVPAAALAASTRAC